MKGKEWLIAALVILVSVSAAIMLSEKILERAYASKAVAPAA